MDAPGNTLATGGGMEYDARGFFRCGFKNAGPAMNGKRTRVNIRDVARHAGLSPQTVSAVLNGGKAHLFRPATRQRCHDAAQALGYVPNTAALAISTGRFMRMGLLVATGNEVGVLSTKLLHGIHGALNGLGERYGLSLDFFDPDAPVDDPGPRILTERSVDALMVNYTHAIRPDFVMRVARFQAPTIWLNTCLPADCVLPDERDGARKAVADLLARGARGVRYFALTDRPSRVAGAVRHYSVAERWDGYVEAMAAAGLPSTMMNESALTHYLTDLAARPGEAGPEAVLTYKETDAVHVLTEALAAGVRVPERLLISTFAARNFLSPRVDAMITTWLIPHQRMGLNAVEALLAKIAQPSLSLPPRWIRYNDEPAMR